MAENEMAPVEQRLLEVAQADPGVEPLTAIDDGRLPYAHSSVKRAAAALRSQGLLWPSRPAWLLLTKKGRAWAKGHPCRTRCWRIGDAADLDEHGVCQECGKPDLLSQLTEREQVVLQAVAKHGPIRQDEFLSEFCQDIPDSARPTVLVSLRRHGWLAPWNGLVPVDDAHRDALKRAE